MLWQYARPTERISCIRRASIFSVCGCIVSRKHSITQSLLSQGQFNTQADVPSVALEGLDVSVDNHILTIRGQARHTVTGEVTYREYELVNFFRQCKLSNQVDQNRITADLKGGVLILQLPKAAEAKPRQIAVRVD